MSERYRTTPPPAPTDPVLKEIAEETLAAITASTKAAPRAELIGIVGVAPGMIQAPRYFWSEDFAEAVSRDQQRPVPRTEVVPRNGPERVVHRLLADRLIPVAVLGARRQASGRRGPCADLVFRGLARAAVRIEELMPWMEERLEGHIDCAECPPDLSLMARPPVGTPFRTEDPMEVGSPALYTWVARSEGALLIRMFHRFARRYGRIPPDFGCFFFNPEASKPEPITLQQISRDLTPQWEAVGVPSEEIPGLTAALTERDSTLPNLTRREARQAVRIVEEWYDGHLAGQGSYSDWILKPSMRIGRLAGESLRRQMEAGRRVIGIIASEGRFSGKAVLLLPEHVAAVLWVAKIPGSERVFGLPFPRDFQATMTDQVKKDRWPVALLYETETGPAVVPIRDTEAMVPAAEGVLRAEVLEDLLMDWERQRAGIDIRPALRIGRPYERESPLVETALEALLHCVETPTPPVAIVTVEKTAPGTPILLYLDPVARELQKAGRDPRIVHTLAEWMLRESILVHYRNGRIPVAVLTTTGGIPLEAGLVESGADPQGIIEAAHEGAPPFSKLPQLDQWGQEVEPQELTAGPQSCGGLHPIEHAWRQIRQTPLGRTITRELQVMPSLFEQRIGIRPPQSVAFPVAGCPYLPQFAALKPQEWRDACVWGTYRVAKQVFNLEPRLVELLAGTPWPERAPAEALRLPGTCPIVCFVWEGQDRTVAIRYDVVPGGDGVLAPFIELSEWTGSNWRYLGDLDMSEGQLRLKTMGPRVRLPGEGTDAAEPLVATRARADQRRLTTLVLSALLYLAGNADTVKMVHPGRKPRAENRVERKDPERARDLKPPTEYAVGRHIVRLIEHWEETAQSARRSGTGRAVRPHLRRGHWHLFWTGPRLGQREPLMHFLATMAVKGAQVLDEMADAQEYRVR